MKKAAQRRLFCEAWKNYFFAASLAASTAAPAALPAAVAALPAAAAALPAEEAASLAASTAVAAAPTAAEAASVAGAGAGAGASTAGAGAGAGASSFLPQAAKATAVMMAAKTRDLFIFTILDELRKQFPEIVKSNLNQNPSYVLTWERTRALSLYPAINYMLENTTLKTLGLR
ncbi:MAG: hypothetical protein PHR71_01655 [Polaromonas sp.]|nr:hypothetical protein [Polaromonas sp.]